MSSAMKFPSPVGGVPLASDFAPSVVFASLYGCLALVVAYRLARPATRTLAIFGVYIFIIERIVAFSLRAEQASRRPLVQPADGRMIYWQITFATGYVTLWLGAHKVLQSLIVNTTIGRGAPKGASGDLELTASRGSSEAIAEEMVLPDEPETRAKYRGWFGLLALPVWVPIVLGIVSGNTFPKAMTDPSKIATVRNLRFAGNIVAFFLVASVNTLAVWAFFSLPRIRRKDALLIVLGVGGLINMMIIYRIPILLNMTTSLFSTAPRSLNTPVEKTLFYVLHATPEFMATATLACVDVRRTFGTGMWGDALWDPKPKAGAPPAAPSS